ncbi:hypothetical protein N7G274_007990 [Stereocaulon virgatum]|uniref:Uncharacterized protein n=1 Tax=Stereocaulon virgatum TaxID=373712 RepID=A0ABR4A072_9LECA
MDWLEVPKENDDAGSDLSGLPVTERQSSGPRHDLDLPQLYTKPSAALLLSTLSQLALGLSSWDVDAPENKEPSLLDGNGVPSYLTRIISSPLNWIEKGEDKEAIWEAASKRLSERSGRTAMPSMRRTFVIPVLVPTQDATTDQKFLNIQLYEPSLTGDNLGHKTWIASYLLAKRLPILLPRHFPSIRFSSSTSTGPATGGSTSSDVRPRVLELGAGTGLVGLAASGLFSVDIHLTDLAPIVANLEYNIRQSQALAKCRGSDVSAGELDWSESPGEVDEEEKYDIIFAADSLYAPEHSVWLVATMANYIRKGAESRVFVELPLRPDSCYPEDFRAKMHNTGFGILEEGEETGYDDWQDSSHEGLEVRCWWSVWAWASASGVED